MRISIGYDERADQYTLAVHLGEWIGTTDFRLGSDGGAIASRLRGGGWMGANAVGTLQFADWVQENADALAAQHPRDWTVAKIEFLAARIRELATQEPAKLPRWA